MTTIEDVITLEDTEKNLPPFLAPIIQDNSEGWGPCELPDQFKDIPYQPFSKGDRLGKVSFCKSLKCIFFYCLNNSHKIEKVE